MEATVYITGCEIGRGRWAEQQLRAAAGHNHVHFLQADATTVGGNQQLAQPILAETGQLHILGKRA